MEKRPDFAELSRIEESLLVAKLNAARAVLDHAGEKGRSLEVEAASILRRLLPAEYGLSSGFIVYRDNGRPVLTPQLDIVIYDAARCGPLAHFGACDVFPLEAVYGYVEVKAALRSVSDKAQDVPPDSIEYCLQRNRTLRCLRTRSFWTSEEGSTTKVKLIERNNWIAIRGYVFAFAASGTVASDSAQLAQRMADVSQRLGDAHLHGVFIAGSAYLQTRAVDDKMDPNYHAIDHVTEHALVAFKTSLLRSLARFPRFPADWTPAIETYYEEPDWVTALPGPQ